MSAGPLSGNSFDSHPEAQLAIIALGNTKTLDFFPQFLYYLKQFDFVRLNAYSPIIVYPINESRIHSSLMRNRLAFRMIRKKHTHAVATRVR